MNNKLMLAATLLAMLCATMRAEDRNITKSPDGLKEAFTRDNDLWMRSLPDSVETRLTFDGSELILNGYASWVYYEEILGRTSRYRAFWWSPDSRHIAFYRFDNSLVPMFPIYSPFGQDGKLLQTRYPKAGETNPSVCVGVVDVSQGGHNTVWADFEEGVDQYFGIPFWGDDSKELYIAREPRRQNTLDLYAFDVSNGSRRHVYHEEYLTWLDWIDGMVFTRKGFYMARSFETGWEQIYFLGFDGSLKKLTDGKNWNIVLLKADEKTGDLWFTARRDSRLHQSLYKLDKRGCVTALTDPEYSVRNVKFSDDGCKFTADLSTAREPWKTVEGNIHKYDVKTILDTVKLVPGKLPSPQIVKIENDGFDLYALMSLPHGFDPSKKYPVLMQLYGGPGTPYVRDIWADRDASDQWCYDNGIIYIVTDPRSSGENGRRGMDSSFGRITVIELQDYVAWARWLQGLPYIDGSRIGVEGFSFGGTMTVMLVLRYPQYFRCGVAGGGVYDWRLYDSHYTERFMDLPSANPDGYQEASPLTFVPKVLGKDTSSPRPLDGALKLTHGTGDDNVHFQNTLQLIDALQKTGYLFELMIYPDGMHGYRGYQHEHDKADDHAFWAKWLLD